MSIKYSLNDVLIESSVRDYSAIRIDPEWTPTQTHERKMERIFRKAERRAFRIPGWVAAAASVVVLFGVLASVKPVRDAVGSFFGLRGGDGTQTGQATGTGSGESRADETTHGETDPYYEDPYIEFESLIESLAANGYDEQKWKRLDSFGKWAFDNCCAYYFAQRNGDRKNAVYSVFCAEKLTAETGGDWGKFTNGLHAYQPQDLNDIDAIAPGWLTAFADAAYGYAKTHIPFDSLREDYPYTYTVLTVGGYEKYEYPVYDPSKRTISENIDRILNVGYDERTYRFLRTFDAYEYCVKEYFNEENAGRRAVMSVICADCIRNFDDDGKSSKCTFPLKMLLGVDGYRFLFEVDGVGIDPRRVGENTQLYAGWLDRYTKMLERAASEHEKSLFTHDFDLNGMILDRVGFSGYRSASAEEKRLTDFLDEALTLYNAVRFGSVLYGEKNDYERVNPLTDEMIKHLAAQRGTDYVDDVELIKFTDGMRTLAGWKEKYLKLLPADAVSRMLRETERFYIIDGEVYIDVYTTLGNPFWTVCPGTLRVSGKTGNTYSARAVVSRRYAGYCEETFEIEEQSDGSLRLVGGTFFEKYYGAEENEVTKAHAAEAVYEVLRAYSALYNGVVSEAEALDECVNSEVFETVGFRRLDGGNDTEGLSGVKADLPAYAGVYCGRMGLYRYAARPIADLMLSEGGPVSYARFAASPYAETVILISPAKAKALTVPQVDPAEGFSRIGVYNALKTVSSSGKTITVALDFERTVNGEKSVVTYTFTVGLKNEGNYNDGYPELIGGTFADMLTEDK